ncbi:MAG: efflux RND transporter permease subunit [Rhodobacteraceae bacterium]|nr:efflux RND transporter permease subunit [Paracoccaceae bacterium]
MIPPAGGLLRSGFARIFVARPVLTIVINLLIVVAGIAALMAVEVREMPDVDTPVLSLRTMYEGADANTVDRQVTAPLEDSLAQLDGLRGLSATSRYGQSDITIDLAPGLDIDIAANAVREIVAQALRNLPDGIEEPRVRKNNSDASPIIRLALSGDASLVELTALAEGRIIDRLSTIDGIAEVLIWGDQAQEFRVSVDMTALLGRGLSLQDLTNALTGLRNDVPLGSINADTSGTVLRTVDPEVTAERIGNLLINPTTRVSDVAFVQLTTVEGATISRVDGERAVSLQIVRQSLGNTLTISLEVRKAVAELQRDLPEGVKLIVTSDDGVFIESSIVEVTAAIGMAILIVIAVIFVFLQSWRATLIPTLAIPVAMFGAIAALWLAGFSINTISLLAFVLATGMVVDDSIVVVENIVRRRSEGLGPRVAAVEGANEVFFAVVSTTATLAAVFVPISFLPGQAGGVFGEFGFVLAFCVLVSSVVALTLAPMLAALLDPGRVSPKAQGRPAGPGLLARGILGLVDRAIRYPLITLGMAIGFAIYAAFMAISLSSEITPPEDRSYFFIIVTGPPGSTVDYVDEQTRQIEEKLNPFRATGEVRAVQSIVGFGGAARAFIIVRLAEWDARERSQQAISSELNRALHRIPGVRVAARAGNSLGIRGAGRGLVFAVTGNADYEALTAAADAMVAVMGNDPVFTNPQLSAETNDPLLEVVIDQDLARGMGLSVADIAATIRAMTEGIAATSVFVEGEEVDVRITPGGRPVDDPSDLETGFARLPDGRFIPLSSVAAFHPTVSAAQLAREGGMRAVGAQANLAVGTDLGNAAAHAREIAADILPAKMSLTLLGEAAALEDSKTGTLMVFAVAGLIVLLVLSAQFESLASAVVIMLTVPFGLGAALLAIQVTGGTLNYYSQIGLVLLIGVMAKNGILIVEFANQLRERGRDIDTAIREAMQIRLRPVMMTMISTVFGGLPLILTSGAGAEARMAVGWVIVVGLGFATVFTLFLTPVLYRWIAPFGSVPGAAARRLANEVDETLAGPA